ncbi:flagellar hook-associated family protein [Aurantimonas sp. VKM B-3413]|uniref:flagellar hook-associated family protein n=1 Tax=Aurantimonas sp. VKM B-3413 TaxID=2779401 RepID=UPI001E5E0E5C|nr:flagellar hook-associated family protein [Aurantimonas sp. VKM B-3413]MCB8838132.1 flagellar hook-associated family protein [Aurantimonas sp. VKM B-3413]
MSNFLVSNLSLMNAPRSAISRIQSDLTKAQKEVTTGHLDDVGLALGVRTIQTISLRAEQEAAHRQRQSNSIISQRFEIMQTSLQSLADTGNSLLQSVMANGTEDAGINADMDQASANMQQFVGALNASLGSRFLFSGSATDQAPISFTEDGTGLPSAGYDGSTAQKSVSDALSTYMSANGISAMSTMTDTQLDAFLDKYFDDSSDPDNLFNDANWTANWSKADNASISNRISDSETINSSYSANSQAFRNIAKAYVMMSDLGADGMNDSARQLLTRRATETLSRGLSQLTTIQAEIGGNQQRLDTTDEALNSRSNVLKLSISSFEDVDPYEASTRVTTLTNLLESSYALTARISRMSLLDYL